MEINLKEEPLNNLFLTYVFKETTYKVKVLYHKQSYLVYLITRKQLKNFKQILIK